MTKTLLRAAMLSCALMTTTCLTAPAMAQFVAPPNLPIHDANGVDLRRGTFNHSVEDVSIGSGEFPQRLSLVRTYSGDDAFVGAFASQASHNFDMRVYRETISGVTKVYVVRGPATEEFTQTSPGVYTTSEAGGSTLTGTFVNGAEELAYRFRDGSAIRFSPTDSFNCDATQQKCGRPTVWEFPSGARISFAHFPVSYTTGTFPNISIVVVPALASVTNNFGYRLSFQNQKHPRLLMPVTTSVTASNLAETGGTATVQYGYHSVDPKLETITDTQGQVTTLGYSGYDLTSIRPPGESSPTETVAYASGRVSSVTRAGIGSWTYSIGGTQTTVTDPLSHTTTLNFGSDPLPQWVEDGLGRRTNYQYDSNHRVTRITAPEGNYVQYAYDGRGNITEARRRDKAGNSANDIVVSASYASSCANPATCNLPLTTTDARGNVTDYTYDSTHGGLLSVTLPAPTSGATRPQVRYTYTQRQAWYDTGGGVAASGLPVYMPAGGSQCQAGSAPSCVGTSAEVKTSLDYGPTSGANNLDLASVSSGAGDNSLTATSAFTYDQRGNLLTVDGPLAGSADTTRYRYDSERRVTGVVGPDPDGAGSLNHRATRTTHDVRGRVTSVERGTVNSQSDSDWAGFSALETGSLAYDSGSRLVRQSLSAGGTTYAVTQMSYDNANRPQCTAVRMNPSIFGSLPTDACTLGTQGSFGPDRIIRNSYDAANQLTLVQTGYGVTGVQADEVATAYTNNGQVSHVTDAEGNRTTYEYDVHDRLAKTRFPSPTADNTSSTTDYEQPTYDAAGNVTSLRLREGQSIAFSYDNLNRVTLKNVPNIVYGEHDVSYAYDNLSRPTLLTGTNGHSIAFAYDALGRVTSETGNYGAKTLEYDLAGRMIRMSWPDAVTIGYDYNVTGEVTTVRENPASTNFTLATYAYDNVGRRTSLTRGNGTVTTYDYDPVSRLDQLVQNLAGTTSDLTLDFTHNPASQIHTATRSNDAFSFLPANANVTDAINGLNQITQTGATNVSHDGRGNISAIGTGAFAYTSENRLATRTNPSAFIGYDPAGRLLSTSGPTYTILEHLGATLVTERANVTFAVLRRYVHGPGVDEPIVWYEGSGASDRRWFHADERGSIVAVSDASGNLVGTRNRYDDYGVPQGTLTGRFGFTGQAWVPELGLYYYRARMYNPALGRFMQTDPIGYGDGMNLYAYVGNDPVNLVDPEGTRCAFLRAIARHPLLIAAWVACMAVGQTHRPVERATPPPTSQPAPRPPGGPRPGRPD